MSERRAEVGHAKAIRIRVRKADGRVFDFGTARGPLSRWLQNRRIRRYRRQMEKEN